jgi:predicted hotdog family 3-hydroxylacyl-ACP dehydratase
MTLKGKDLERLIPQRFPFVMVDEFEQCDDQQAVTRLNVRSGNYFLLPDGTMTETGLIEHMAQSCSALAGSRSKGDAAPIGMIVEVKHFHCTRRPQSSEQIETRVVFGLTFGQMTLAHCTSCIGGETIAETDLKIFVE